MASTGWRLVLAAYMLIGNWQLRNDCTLDNAPRCYTIRDPLDLAVVAAVVLGACFGFVNIHVSQQARALLSYSWVAVCDGFRARFRHRRGRVVSRGSRRGRRGWR